MSRHKSILQSELPAEFGEYGPFGVAPAAEVEEDCMRQYSEWLAEGKHAGMDYLIRHTELRRNPANLLKNARSVIVFAFPYASPQKRAPHLPMISEYALGNDYHDVVRDRLEYLASLLPGGEHRICVDSAPIPERYWGVKSGLGYIGKNGMLIVPPIGSKLFLGEIITTLDIEPSVPLKGDCGNCRRCLDACPASALKSDATIDCRRCLSYLTIEHRGEWTDKDALAAINTPAGKNTLYGCDRCVSVCPMNIYLYKSILPGLQPRPEMLSLDASCIREMSQEEFSRFFRGSAMKRAKLAGLKRNAR